MTDPHDARFADFALAASHCGVARLGPDFARLSLTEKSDLGKQLLAELRARADGGEIAARDFLASTWGRAVLIERPAAAQSIESHEAAAQVIADAIASLPRYPGSFAGRGIVTCAGGPVYQTCATVLFTLLRQLGCSLPIECWRTGPSERDEGWERFVAEEFDVVCIDGAARGYLGHPLAPPLSFREFAYAPGALHGYALKPFAVIHSAFREILFLDADNTPQRDPTFLFDAPEYLSAGSVFWPDLPDCRLAPELAAFGVDDGNGDSGPPQNWESGQLLLDKRRAWPALALANWFNAHAPHFYRYSWGDCGTWQAAWKRLAVGWAMPETFARRAGEVALVQHDFAGAPLFFHRVGRRGKWRLDPFEPTPGFSHNGLCRAALERLARSA